MKERVEKASRIEKKQFEVYKPLIEEVRKDKPSAMYGFLLLNLRRLTMFFMAMYILKKRWLILQVFIATSFIALAY